MLSWAIWDESMKFDIEHDEQAVQNHAERRRRLHACMHIADSELFGNHMWLSY